jgi:tRNA A-37 threonylcarbamoyl transferase component Bud32
MWLFDLTQEFKAMRDAAALGAPVVPVVADSLRLLEGVGGGYLLAHCGVPFDATASMAACTAAFGALAELHALAVLHGDARLPNLLLVDGHAAWVDLSAGHVLAGLDAHTRAANCRLEMEALARSVLLAAGVTPTPLPSSVTAAIAAYSAADGVHTIAAAVWAALRVAS